MTLLALVPACGDGEGRTTIDSDPHETEMEATFTASEVAAQRAAEVECRRAWQPLLGHLNVETSAPSRIASTGRGIIYQVSLGSPQESLIRALPITDAGPPITLLNGWYSNLWVEGSRLFYTTETPSLLSVPMEGGSPQLEVEATEHAAGVGGAITELTPEHLYWLDVATTESAEWRATLYRVARAGGSQELIAEIDGPYLQLQRAEGGRMIAWSVGAAAVIESDGSVRALFERAPGMWVLGTDSSGIFVTDLDDGSIWRVPVDGGERRPFLADRDFSVENVWSDGDGGWLIHSVSYPPSGEQLVRLYSVSPEGGAELLACDPLARGALLLSNPVFTDDAIYFAAQYSDMWQLVRVDRAPAEP